MSHELRTPLNAILNFSRFVSEGMLGDVNSDQIETLGKVNDNGKHLLSLINDLLDISKIEAGQLKLFVEDDIDMNKVFTSVSDVAESLLADKPVRLVTEVDPDLPLVLGDKRRIRQILLNLVSNACKFTDEGEVKLELRREEDTLLFSVTDTGPGIAQEDQEAVFDTFHQTANGIKQGAGTGLGLPISRRLAEIHGGSLWLESTPGNGATFFVRLPIHAESLQHLKYEQDALVSA
jgi:signal transduction histidine kinase